MAKKVEARFLEPQVYIGPSLLKKGLKRFMVFRNGLPSFVTTLIQEIPEISRLIVPVAELETARTKVGTAGTYEHRMYVTVAEKAGV